VICLRYLPISNEPFPEVSLANHDSNSAVFLDCSSRFSKLLDSASPDGLKVLKEFSADVRRSLTALDQLIEEKGSEASLQEAHKLKGVTGFMGLRTPSDLSAELESSLKEGDWSSSIALKRKLRDELDRYLDLIKKSLVDS